MKYLKWLPFILEVVVHLIKQVEDVIIDGHEKKKAVMESLKQMLTDMGIYSDTFMNFISITIDAYVFFYHLIGEFKHKRKE